MRKGLLLHPCSPDALVRLVARSAMSAAKRGTLEIKWTRADSRCGYWRAEAAVPLEPDIFDQLFNSRAGYRAQYYLSVLAGRRFNKLLTEALRCALRRASNRCRPPVQWSLIQRSLSGPHSKIWLFGDWAPFIGEPEYIRPDRWVNHYRISKHVALGLRAPLPAAPVLDLKGTFICPSSESVWLPASKRDRDRNIRDSGWT